MIFKTLLLSAVAATFATTATAQITSLDDLSESKTYTISNSRGALAVASSTDTDCKKTTSVSTSETLHQWVLIKSTLLTTTPSYYFYNVGAGKFLSYNQSNYKATLTDANNLTLDNCFQVASFKDNATNPTTYFKISSATSPSWFLAFSSGFNVGDGMGFTANSNYSDAGASINFTQATESYTDNTAKDAVTTFETAQQTTLNTQITALKNAISSNTGKIGYPTQDAYTAFTTAVDATDATYEQKSTAISTLLAKANIVLPTDGKAYYIRPMNKGVTVDNATYYLYTNANGQLYYTQSAQSSAIFYAHKVGEKFIFTNSKGKYMTFRSDGNEIAKQENGVLDEYAACCQFSLLPFYFSGTDESCDNGNVTTASVDYLGLLLIQGAMTGDATNSTSNLHYLMTNTSDTKTDPFHAAGTGAIYYTTSGNTCAYYFQEADQENAFKATEMKVQGVDYYLGSYSSPFPVVLPKELTAYKVSQVGETASLQPIEKTKVNEVDVTVIPANTGVIISAPNTDQVIPTARTTETLATVENNKLVATTGEAVATGTKAFILGYDSDKTANFYILSSTNRVIKQYKAYLNLTESSANQMVLSFGGSTTGIQQAAGIDAAQTKAVYDLSGRRVSKPTHGFYIVNGKKTLVK